jgi:hypothetical protein
MILMELLTITVQTFCFDDIDGIVDHHCSNLIPSISSKQKV